MMKVFALVALIAVASANQVLLEQAKTVINKVYEGSCYQQAAQNALTLMTPEDEVNSVKVLGDYVVSFEKCSGFLQKNAAQLFSGYFKKDELALLSDFFLVTGKCFSDIGAMLQFVEIYEQDPNNTQQDVIIAIIEAYYARGTAEVCKDVPYLIKQLWINTNWARLEWII